MLSKCQLLINPYYLKTMFCCQNVLKFSDLVPFSYFMAEETGIRKGEWLFQGHSGTTISLGPLPLPKRQVLHPLFLFCWFVGQNLLFPHHQLLRYGSSSPRKTGPREERKTYAGSIYHLKERTWCLNSEDCWAPGPQLIHWQNRSSVILAL